MKPLHVGLLLAGAVIAGGVVMKLAQRTPSPAALASEPQPVALVPQAPPEAEVPVPIAIKPKPATALKVMAALPTVESTSALLPSASAEVPNTAAPDAELSIDEAPKAEAAPKPFEPGGLFSGMDPKNTAIYHYANFVSQ